MRKVEGCWKRVADHYGITLDEYKLKRESGQKHCRKCDSWKSLDAFSIDNSRHDKRCSVCIKCRSVGVRKSTKGRPSWFKGRSHTAEAKELMRLAKLGKPSGRLGKKHTPETRRKISEIVRAKALRGPQCPAYKDGRNAARHDERKTLEYKRWRFDVYSRDGFTCQQCGDAKGGNLNAHHILPFASHPLLRTVVSNGITLCKPCHDALHSAQGK